MGHPAVGDSLDGTLFAPGLEVLDFGDGAGVLHPLDDLGHGDEVDVVVVGQNLIDPVEEGIEELGIVLQPRGVEEETKRSAVLLVMAIEVVVEEVVELVSGQDVGARVNHGTSSEVLVEVGVLPTIKLVHHHLPDGVASGRAALQVAVTTVGHPEVQGVGPERRVVQGSGDGAVVEEGLLLHHGELVVATDTQVGGAHSDHGVVGQVGVLLDDDAHASHFLGPVVNGGVAPELLVIVVAEIEVD